MRQVRRLTPAEADRLRDQQLTYAEVGRSAAPYPAGYPDGYRHVRHREVIGTGRELFDQAGRNLLSWRMHLDSGLRVAASSLTVEPDAVVLLRLGLGPVALKIPCRVVYVVDEPDRQGFGYGTLPGHPESGEEAFVVDIGEHEQVALTVSTFSRAQTRLARLGGPLTWLAQRLALRRYAAALRSR